MCHFVGETGLPGHMPQAGGFKGRPLTTFFLEAINCGYTPELVLQGVDALLEVQDEPL